MTARKNRLLRRLDNMTVPLLLDAVLKETPTQVIAFDELGEIDQERLLAYEKSQARAEVFEPSHIAADGTIEMVKHD